MMSPATVYNVTQALSLAAIIAGAALIWGGAFALLLGGAWASAMSVVTLAVVRRA